MSYLKFDKSIMTNLGVSMEKEVLRTNRRGSYLCTTVLGCNTRKYHGLLVVPSPAEHKVSQVLLSSLDETVIQHGAEFNLAVHRYRDGTYSPNGHKYVREFEVDGVIRTLYRVGGVVLSKEVLFSEERNQLMVRYKLVEAHSRTRLRLRPILAYRAVKELTMENGAIDWGYAEESNGVSMCLYAGMPRLYMQLSRPKVEWHHDPRWYKDFRYDKEAERGHECTEDLPVPGYFECEINKGEEIIFSASDEVIDVSTLAGVYRSEEQSLWRQDSFLSCLKNAVNQYYYSPDEEHGYILSGFPWFGVRFRDQMVGLTACSYGIGKPERFEVVMDTALKTLWDYLDRGVVGGIISDVDKPDSILWLINAIQDYHRWVGGEQTKDKYGAVLEKAIEYLMEDRVPNMKLHDNALLYAMPPSMAEPITWMDNTLDGYPVVDRKGFIVEYNALWYNALCFYRDLMGVTDHKLHELIERVSESFVRVFVNEHDYLFDYVVEGQYHDWNVRPNQIFAAGLTYSPLSRKLQRSVLDIVTKELLTPKGLRTLSPKSPYYRGYCDGPLHDRFYAYLQGGVWCWLLYYYLSAYLKLFKRGGVPFIERLLIPFEEEMKLHGVGNISEIYDGTPPFRGRSAISFMMSVTAILRIQNRLEEFNDFDTDDIFDLQLSLTSHHRTSPDIEDDGAAQGGVGESKTDREKEEEI